MWDVEPEISDLNMTLNAMTHLNLLKDATQSFPNSTTTFGIPGPPSSVHDVELQYADDDDVDPFRYL